MTRQSTSAPLSFREKFGYGLGDMASNFYMGFFGLFLLYYYTDVFGISPAAAATMLLVTKIIDAISDPAMGLLADRTQTRWGKYRPYLLWMAIPYAILGYLLFLGPDLSPAGKLLYAYLTYTLVMLAYTAINVPYSALLAVISPSASERTKATQFRFVLASIGTLTIGALATPLVDILGGGDEVLGFRLTMALFAVLSIVLFWISFATTQERVRPATEKRHIKNDLKSLVQNSSWVVLGITSILIVVGLNARFASIVFYLKYYMLDDGTRVFLIFDKTALLTSCGLIGQLIGALITPMLAARYEKHHLLVSVNLLHLATLLACYFLPAQYYGMLVALHTIGIFTFGITITLLFAMYSDCAEYGEWQTGINTAGLTVSASLFALKFGSAIGAALPGFALAWFGFVANEAQTDTALQGIRLMFNVLPAIFFTAGGLMMLRYRLDRATLERVETELDQRRCADEKGGQK